MKIVFFGTPEYVVCILDALQKKFRNKKGESPIVAVITQEPKPTGRKKTITFSEVDHWAYKRNIKIFHSPNEFFESQISADLGVLAAYGEIIPQNVISAFPGGILNIHPSLLPQFRGASPVQATIMSGLSISGVSIIKIDNLMDHGIIVSQFKQDVLPDDTTRSLRDRMFFNSAEVVAGLIEPYLQGKIRPKAQRHYDATFTRMLKKESGFIPPSQFESVINGKFRKQKLNVDFIKDAEFDLNPINVERFIRAMDPWPYAWTYVNPTGTSKNPKNIKRLKILKAHTDNEGKILIPDMVHLEGKNEVEWKEFQTGYPKAKF